MNTATLSTKGQLVIPARFRRALNLRAGDKVLFQLKGGQLVIRCDERRQARLVDDHGRKVLVAPPGAPPMTPENIRTILAEFP